MAASALTERGKSVIIRTQAQEQKQRDKPNAYSEECCNVHESRGVVGHLPTPISILRTSITFRLLSFRSEMEEPSEMICDDQETGKDESE